MTFFNKKAGIPPEIGMARDSPYPAAQLTSHLTLTVLLAGGGSMVMAACLSFGAKAQPPSLTPERCFNLGTAHRVAVLSLKNENICHLKGVWGRAAAPLHPKESVDAVYLVKVPHGCLPFQVFWARPTRKKLRGRPRTLE